MVNIRNETLIETVVKAAAEYPSNVDEIKEIGLTALGANKVSSPRISEDRFSLECRLMPTLEIGVGENLRTLIFGGVLLLHVKDEVWAEENINPSQLIAVGR